MMKSLLLMLALVFVAPAAIAAQGSGVGTLPAATRNVGWLSAHQTISLTHGEIVFVIGSTHNNDADVMPPPPPPDEPQILRHSWKWNGVDVEVKTPRLANESGAAGEERWEQRHAEAVHRALMKWPRDA
jgi:hypothetical protein